LGRLDCDERRGEERRREEKRREERRTIRSKAAVMDCWMVECLFESHENF
jgi:hypothetical protein